MKIEVGSTYSADMLDREGYSYAFRIVMEADSAYTDRAFLGVKMINPGLVQVGQHYAATWFDKDGYSFGIHEDSDVVFKLRRKLEGKAWCSDLLIYSVDFMEDGVSFRKFKKTGERPCKFGHVFDDMYIRTDGYEDAAELVAAVNNGRYDASYLDNDGLVELYRICERYKRLYGE